MSSRSSSCSDYDSSNDSYDSSSSRSNRFYETVVDTTLAARERRREQFKGPSKLPLTRSRYIKKVKNAIERLTDQIVYDWKRKVVDASENGYSNVNLYEYSKGEKYEGLPVVLLMTGPRNDSEFFKNNGLFSVVEEVMSDLCGEGFRVEYKFVGNGKNVINIDWRAGLYDAE